MKLFSLLWIICLLLNKLQGQRAPNWDICDCQWEAWKDWSDCTSTCFGQQLRKRDVTLTTNDVCDEFEDCDYGDGGRDQRGNYLVSYFNLY